RSSCAGGRTSGRRTAATTSSRSRPPPSWPRSSGLLHEAAAPALGAHRVVGGVVEGQDLPGRRRQRGLGLRRQRRLLMLLLRLVPPAVERMEGEAPPLRPVGGAAVPEVRVHHNEVAGAAGDEDLLRVGPARVVERVLRPPAPPVRAGYRA